MISKPKKEVGMIVLAVGLFLVGAALIIALPDLQSQALNGNELSAIPIEVDIQAPQIALADLQGNLTELKNTLGYVVLVNNWAIWCPPCKAEMPALQAFYESYADEGFVIVAVESGSPVEDVSSFVRQYGMTFPVWLDPQGKALDAFNNYSLPNSYVIDREGTIRLTWTGAITRNMLEKYVASLIRE